MAAETEADEIHVELENSMKVLLGRISCQSSTSSTELATASCHCVDCILHLPDHKIRAGRLKNFFSNLRKANNSKRRHTQLYTLRKLNYLMLSSKLLATYQLSFDNFRTMLIHAGLIRALLHIMTLRTPEQGDINKFWPSIVYYSLSILGGLVSEGLEEDDARSLKTREKVAEKICESDVAVQQLLSFVQGAREVVEMMRALWVLRQLSYLSPTACMQIVKHSGVQSLAELLVAGHWQKLVRNLLDRGMRPYVKLLVAEEMLKSQETLMELQQCDLDDHSCYKSLIRQSSEVQGLCAIMLSSIAVNHMPSAKKLFDPKFNQIPAVLRWLKQPILTTSVRKSTTGNVLGLISTVCTYKPLALQLVNDYQLLELIERMLYVPDSWPLDLCVDIVCLLIDINDLNTNVSDNRGIVFALGCHAYSTDDDLSKVALITLCRLCRTSPELLTWLHRKGLINQLMLMNQRTVKQQVILKHIHQLAALHVKNWNSPSLKDMPPSTGCRRSGSSRQKELGNDNFHKGDYRTAIYHYTVALSWGDYRVQSAVLFTNRAECHLRLDEYEAAMRDSTLSIGCTYTESDVYIKTLFRRAKAFLALHRPFEALGDAAVCVRSSPKDTRFKTLYDDILKIYTKLDGVLYTVHKCSECQLESESFRKCKRCSTYFCSRTCQLRAWPVHKLQCLDLPPSPKSNNQPSDPAPEKLAAKMEDLNVGKHSSRKPSDKPRNKSNRSAKKSNTIG